MDDQEQFFSADEVGSDEAIAAWNETAPEFASFFAEGEEFYHKHVINPCIVDLLGDLEGRTILDLACGEGHLARRLAELAGSKLTIVGVDASKEMIRIAGEKNGQFKDCISFQTSDAARMPQFEAGTFDVVVCNMALMDIRNYREAIGEAARVLKPDGVFIFSVLHPCFHTPGSGWLRKDPEATDQASKIGWKVDNYYCRLVSKRPLKPDMQHAAHYFHRTLEDYFAALRDSGFVVIDLCEPLPRPEHMGKADLKRPDFLAAKCVLLPQVQ